MKIKQDKIIEETLKEIEKENDYEYTEESKIEERKLLTKFLQKIIEEIYKFKKKIDENIGHGGKIRYYVFGELYEELLKSLGEK